MSKGAASGTIVQPCQLQPCGSVYISKCYWWVARHY